MSVRIFWLGLIIFFLAACQQAGESEQSKTDRNSEKLDAVDSGATMKEFDLSKHTLMTTGRNDFFILETGYRLVLDGGMTEMQITVLEETRMIGDIETRVVEEREWEEGSLTEVSRNFYAISRETGDVFYFGEEVEKYTQGKMTGHEGAWQAWEHGAMPGMIMPGEPREGMRFFMGMAPQKAMDWAEIVSLDAALRTPVGLHENCLKVREGTQLNPDEEEFKTYARGIGLIRAENMFLVEYGFSNKEGGMKRTL